MKLLDSSKKAVVVLNESTTKLVYWGFDTPVLIYHVASEVSHGEAKKQQLTVVKVEALNGYYIETDGGTKVLLTGDKYSIVKQLEGLLGVKIGQIDPDFTKDFSIPSQSVQIYKELDTNDDQVISVTVTVNAPTEDYDGEAEVVYSFARSDTSVVYVKDVMAKLPEFEGHNLIGLAPADSDLTEDDCLGKTDKVLEDQALVAVWGDQVLVTFKRGLTEDDETEVDIAVKYDAKVSEAIHLALENETIKGWIENAGYSFKELVLEGGDPIVKEVKKSAAGNLDKAIVLTWDVPIESDEPETTSGDDVTDPNTDPNTNTDAQEGTEPTTDTTGEQQPVTDGDNV